VSDVASGKSEAAIAFFAEVIVGHFHRHGIRPLLFARPEIGGPTDQVAYVIPWESLADYERAWDAFRSDPDWQRANQEANRDGQIFVRTTKTLLRSVPEVATLL
jgi:hypothetical protein